MKEFYAVLSDNCVMSIPATRMEKEECMIYVYLNEDLQAAIDVSLILRADIHPMKDR